MGILDNFEASLDLDTHEVNLKNMPNVLCFDCGGMYKVSYDTPKPTEQCPKCIVTRGNSASLQSPPKQAILKIQLKGKIMSDKIEDTTFYSYKLEMIVQILAEDEPSAAEQLEKNGGYVTSRKVTLMDSAPLFNGKESA